MNSPDPVTERERHPRLAIESVRRGLRGRQRREARFRLLCRGAAVTAVFFLLVLFFDIGTKGWRAFGQTYLRLDVTLDPGQLDPDGDRDLQLLRRADFTDPWRESIRTRFPGVETRQERRELYGLVSDGAQYDLRDRVLADPGLLGTRRSYWLPASDEVDMVWKGLVARDLPAVQRPISDRQLAWIDALAAEGALEIRWNRDFFTRGDSREPEQAGILAALVGSAFTMLVTLLASFPLGVATAIYLEELAPRNRWTDLIEVNINNLAAVPSIVFGLLGLAVFLGPFGLPRSAPLVGGLVLSLMTLPTIIITARVAIQAVPPSIREAALGLGATRLQVIQHHVLPYALPGILTGTILGMARALGETAPLLMIGMVAFIVDVPRGLLDPATVLPVQVYLWADSPERAFVEKTAAAIIVLLGFLIVMNALAVYLRRRWEQRW